MRELIERQDARNNNCYNCRIEWLKQEVPENDGVRL